MKPFRLAFLLLTCLAAFPAAAGKPAAPALSMDGYQDEKGAITLHYHGDTVDPYFSAKALLLAHESGMDISKAGNAWVNWALAMQEKNGLFGRYCRKGFDRYTVCAKADADDAVLALWLELLYTLSPDTGLPDEWQKSADAAKEQLDALYSDQDGIYHISSSMPVGLLMDNVEIYWAYNTISQQLVRMGLDDEATEWRHAAADLARHIHAKFWDKEAKRFRITTQDRYEDVFYPDEVAQVYPWLYRLPLPAGISPKTQWREWLHDNSEPWLNINEDDFPWGMVAATAIAMNDSDSAFCWKQRAEPFRYSDRWNVLEEAAYQQVKWRLQLTPPRAKIPCVQG